MAWTKVAALADLPAGKGKLVNGGKRAVALFRVDSRVYALEAECPHSGGPLAEGQLDGGCVTCPLHDYRFQLEGGKCLTDSDLAAEAYPVKIQGPDVLVDLPESPTSSPAPLPPKAPPAPVLAAATEAAVADGGLRLVRAIVRPEREFEVVEALEKAGFVAMTKFDVLGRGRQRGLQVGAAKYDEVAKVMLMLVVETDRVATAVEVIKTAARTGNFGDGKIFVTPVEDAYTIRTGERGL